MVISAPRPQSGNQQILGESTEKLSDFKQRHIGPNADDIQQMLDVLGVSSLDDLINQTVPQSIRLPRALNLPEALSEYAALAKLKEN